MTEKNFTGGCVPKETYTIKKQRDKKILQTITLTALSLFWIGYGYALYCGNDSNIANYSCLIAAFSLINADVLFTKEKVPNKVLNILAKVHGILFFVWTLITLVLLVLK